MWSIVCLQKLISRISQPLFGLSMRLDVYALTSDHLLRALWGAIRTCRSPRGRGRSRLYKPSICSVVDQLARDKPLPRQEDLGPADVQDRACGIKLEQRPASLLAAPVAIRVGNLQGPL